MQSKTKISLANAGSLPKRADAQLVPAEAFVLFLESMASNGFKLFEDIPAEKHLERTLKYFQLPNELTERFNAALVKMSLHSVGAIFDGSPSKQTTAIHFEKGPCLDTPESFVHRFIRLLRLSQTKILFKGALIDKLAYQKHERLYDIVISNAFDDSTYLDQSKQEDYHLAVNLYFRLGGNMCSELEASFKSKRSNDDCIYGLTYLFEILALSGCIIVPSHFGFNPDRFQYYMQQINIPNDLADLFNNTLHPMFDLNGLSDLPAYLTFKKNGDSLVRWGHDFSNTEELMKAFIKILENNYLKIALNKKALLNFDALSIFIPSNSVIDHLIRNQQKALNEN